VSHNSLSSDYVVDKEIPIIRARQANGERVHFYPLVLTPTPSIALDRVRDKNLRPRDGKPLSSYREYDRWEKMNEVADEIVRLAKDMHASKNRISQKEDIPSSPQRANNLGRAARGSGEEARIAAWLRNEANHPTAVAIGARAALRVVPLVGRGFERRSDAEGKSPTSALIGRSFAHAR
jgi:hypothetical protein